MQQDEETINPYRHNAMQQDEETVNPYGWNMARQGEETVNPYGSADERSVECGADYNRYKMEEEETVNPYSINWMPRIEIGLALEEKEKKWNERVTFFGSVCIGSDAKCELQLQNLDSEGYCAELTYGGGNLYVRNLSRGGEAIYLDGRLLEDDLIPLNKNSVISMCQVHITMEYLSNNAFEG